MLNEFRQDLVSGEWVLFATGRARRPGAKEKQVPLDQSKDNCPFEDPEKAGNVVIATYRPRADVEPAFWHEGTGGLCQRRRGQKAGQFRHRDAWFAKIAKNKFPAVLEGEVGPRKTVGPFAVTDAKGLHEIVIYRDHDRELHQYSQDELVQVFKIYQERYQAMAGYSSSRYILIFHNRGAGAGASIAHPHSQIISIPILPPDVKRSIQGSQDFYDENSKRVYDLMIDWEVKEKKRIIYENENFIAFCPFVSKTPYEVRIFSKESHAHFEQCPPELLPELGNMMSKVLNKIYTALDDPDYNFFIHTAPVDLKSPPVHEFYSWHIEIVPKMKMEGAFELGSGIEVNVVDPDQAAEELRNF